MLIVNYEGVKPICDRYNYSVQGNNNADKVVFVLKKKIGGLNLENCRVYAKVQDTSKTLLDKIEITNSKVIRNNELEVSFLLLAKHTQHKNIEVALSFENLEEEVVFQTRLITISIANQVASDEDIANTYPSVIQDQEQRIEALEEKTEKEEKAVFGISKELYKFFKEHNDDSDTVYSDIRDIKVIDKTLDFSKHTYWLATPFKKHGTGAIKYQNKREKRYIDLDNYKSLPKRYICEITEQLTLHNLIKMLCGEDVANAINQDLYPSDYVLHIRNKNDKYDPQIPFIKYGNGNIVAVRKQNFSISVPLKNDINIEEFAHNFQIKCFETCHKEGGRTFASVKPANRYKFSFSNVLYVVKDVEIKQRQKGGIQYVPHSVIAKLCIANIALVENHYGYSFRITFTNEEYPSQLYTHYGVKQH